MKKILLAALALCISVPMQAKVKLPALVGSNMVLQQQSDVNIWGEAAAGAKVNVKTSWNNKTYSTSADQDGRWNVVVKTPEAGGPYTVTIADKDKTVLDNVLIGDVWVCSGQSNMAMNMGGYMSQPVNGAFDMMFEASPKTDIRLFRMARQSNDSVPMTDCKGKWQVLTPASLAPFSAAAFYFGYNLHKALDIPIGLIGTYWGGTRIEAWMPAERIANVDKELASKKGKGPNATSTLYNGMISPVKKYGAKGFIWYQGEANTSNANIYDKLMAEMVAQWRQDWGGGEAMPFYYVLIAPYRYKGLSDTMEGPMVMEAQVRAEKIIPNSGYAATTDCGEEYCIHPRGKDKVGQRLAAQALAKTYKVPGMPCNAPTFKSVEFKDGVAIVTFNDAYSGINPRTGEIKGFEISGPEKVFYPATATLTGKNKNTNMVKLSSPRVSDPVAVRYAFRNYVECNVTNNYGLPLVPFRTDNWAPVYVTK